LHTTLKPFWLTLFVWAAFAHPPVRAGEACPDDTQDIDTDRPDVTNSSLAVPLGSLQAENGVNWTGGRGSVLDGSNSRVRLGIAQCSEILVDLPNYATPLARSGPSGFSGIAPAIKRQFEALPAGLTAAAVVGTLLPTGSGHFSKDGYAPYIQVPWAQDLSEGWKVDGMGTATWFPSQANALAEQITLSAAHEVGPDAEVFGEYIGDYRTHEALRSSLNFGGSYRFTKTQQIDIHAGFVLNAPGTFFGIGYSLRFDGLE